MDRYIFPDHPRGGAGALRDFKLVWGLHFLAVLPVVGFVEVALPKSSLSYWLQLGPLLLALVGFPIFAFFRHSHIQSEIDRRFDEMPGKFDLDGHPLEHLQKKLDEPDR